jgi:hypothetical protein
MDPRSVARGLLENEDVSLTELWIFYWGNGGDAGIFELDAFIHGAQQL